MSRVSSAVAGFRPASMRIRSTSSAVRLRAARKAPVRVEHRIVTVFPGLVHQAALLAAGVIEKSRGAAVQPPLDPIGRREQTGPDPIDESAIAGARLVGAGEHHEQRRGIHPAAIPTEWNLAQRRHLPAPRLVHDLARLRIAKGRFLLCLSRGEKAQHTRGELRVDPQRLQRGDDRVASELSGKPRDACVRVRTGRQRGRQQREIRTRFVDPLIEEAPGRADPRALPQATLHAR